MHPPTKPTGLWILGGLLLLAVVGKVAVGWFPMRREAPDFTAVPLARSAYLRDVVEPITITEGMSFDDGGSAGLRFRDATGRLWAVCLESDWGSPNGDGGDGKTLALGGFWPGDGRRVPVRGAEEQALAGLLQRWVRDDPEARAWVGRIERWRAEARTNPRIPLYDDRETPAQLTKGRGASLLRSLLARY